VLNGPVRFLYLFRTSMNHESFYREERGLVKIITLY